MKTKLTILIFLSFFTFFSHAQSKLIADSTYAIVQVSSPQTVLGEYTIKISYGNGKLRITKLLISQEKTIMS